MVVLLRICRILHLQAYEPAVEREGAIDVARLLLDRPDEPWEVDATHFNFNGTHTPLELWHSIPGDPAAVLPSL